MQKHILNTYFSIQILDIARFGTIALTIISMIGVVTFAAMITLGSQVSYIIQGLTGNYGAPIPENLISSPIFLNLIIIILLGIIFLSIVLESILWSISFIFTEIRCFMEIKGDTFEIRKAIDLFLEKWKTLYKRRFLVWIPFNFFTDTAEILEGKKIGKYKNIPSDKKDFLVSFFYPLVIIMSIFVIFYLNNIIVTALGIIGISFVRSLVIYTKHRSFRNKINIKEYQDKISEEDDMLYGFTVK